MKIIPKKAAAYFNNLLKEAVKQREQNNISRPDVLHLLLQASRNEEKHNDITDKDIAAQAMIFFLGGFETVATALCFTIYELALNEDIQERLREEIDEAWVENDGKVTFELISKMRYLDMVVSGTVYFLFPLIVTAGSLQRVFVKIHRC